MKAVFRKAKVEDADTFVDLRFELWPHCTKELRSFEVRQLIMSAGALILAEVGGGPVGFAEVSIRMDHVEGTASAPVPYLEGWFIRTPFRGKGFGRGLLSHVEKWALFEGFAELASDAEIKNDLSIRLHSQCGFSEVGRSVHFVKKLKRDDA